MERRSFVNKLALLGLSPLFYTCTANHPSSKQTAQTLKTLKLSLAQWSLHRNFQEGKLDPIDFASISKERYDIDALEYVNSFYKEEGNNEQFWIDMKRRSDQADVKNLLIMTDEEGDFGVSNEQDRNQAVENHYKWVNAAKILGCHSIRVNAFGDEDQNIFKDAMIDAMGKLAEYAAKENINVLIENHGLFSSNADLIVEIIEAVDLPNFGTFPDFGNWCLSAKWGSTQGACEKVYDIYKGVQKFLPHAKAVSAKSYNFDAEGNQTQIDYTKMLKIVKESSYDGYIGIEYEGTELAEHEGILATKALLEKTWKAL